MSREDSDDELGLDDHPWEWIYDSPLQEIDGNRGNDDILDHDGVVDPVEKASSGLESHSTVPSNHATQRPIKGARMGNFCCYVGDSVLLKAEVNNEAWVGLICEFTEDEDGDKAANFMWFSSDKEIRNKEKKRMDAMQVSIPRRQKRG